jgi:predicted ArsR family transcriptional regulator
MGASRVRLLEALHASRRALEVRELVDLCGLQVTTVRFHLGILCSAGLVQRRSERRGGRGRPRLAYHLPPATDDRSQGYELLATMLAARWDHTPAERAQRAEQAGRVAATSFPMPDTGSQVPTLEHAAVRVSVQFAELGFEPEVITEGPQVVIRLHACPFRSVAEKHPDVVCSLHLGLLRGALEQLRAPDSRTSLEPFVQRELCIARLDPSDQRGLEEPVVHGVRRT